MIKKKEKQNSTRLTGMNYIVNMEIIITVNGIERIFGGDYHTLRNNDWNEIIGERLDSLVTEEQEHEKS